MRERRREYVKVWVLLPVHSADTLSLTPGRESGRSRGPLTNCAATERVQCRTAAAADPLFTLSDFNSCKHRIYKQPVRPNSEESDPPTNVVFMERLMYASAFPTGARVTRKSRNAARNVSPSAAVLKACRLTHFLPFNYRLSRFAAQLSLSIPRVLPTLRD